MKSFRIFVPVMALLLSAGISYARQTSTAITNTDASSNAVYQWMYNADNVTHAAGSVVVHSAVTYPGIEFTTTTTANNGLVAGILTQSCAASTFCQVQVAGYYPTVKVAVATTAGDTLVTSTTGEKVGVYSIAQATGTAANQSAILGVVGHALETTTSSTTVKVILLSH